MRGAGDFWTWHEYRGRGTGGVGAFKDWRLTINGIEGLGFIA